LPLFVSFTLRPQPFLAGYSFDSDCLGTTDCLGHHCKDLVGRSSPISEASKIDMSGNRESKDMSLVGGTGGGGQEKIAGDAFGGGSPSEEAYFGLRYR
jgi:hypothetical protein